MSGRRGGEPAGSRTAKDDIQEKALHAVTLSIFSDNGAEAGAALTELFSWSSQPVLTPQPSPCVVISLTQLVSGYMDRWTSGVTHVPALVALTILSNLSGVKTAQDLPSRIKAAVLIGAIPETMLMLHRLSFHPFSPATKLAQNILVSVGRFCQIDHTFKDEAQRSAFVKTLCSLFVLADPNYDEPHVTIFMNFILMRQNCLVLEKEIGADLLYQKIGELLSFPSTVMRDLLLEVSYALVMAHAELRDAACGTTTFLRGVLTQVIPPSTPMEAKSPVPFTPAQKACVLLLELCEDARVISYLARFKMQIAGAILKWNSCGLHELALKVSNATPR